MNNRRQIKEDKGQKKKQAGFTMAEMLVALGILSIVFSIGIVAIGHYQRDLKLTEMDTTAREIFVVAQNRIISAKASGEWERLKEKYKDDPSAYFGNNMEEQPSDYPSEDTWPNGGYGRGHDYRYIVYNNKVDVLDDKLDTLDNTILDIILPYGSIDEEIRREGNYVIEYDYETATVYGVFYTNDSNGISYNRDIMGMSGLNNNKGREDSREGKKARKNYKNDNGHTIIGYYGGAVVKDLELAKLEPLEIKVDNGDILKVTIKDKNYGKVVDGVKAKTMLKVKVTGEESRVSEERILKIDPLNTGARNTQEDWWTAEVDRNTANYTLVLDDITRPGGHFTDIFPKLIPGENIVIEVEAFSDQVLCTPVKEQVYTNSLFEENYEYEESGKSTSRVVVGNIRHLQNLNPEVSNIPTSNHRSNREIGRIVTKVEQSKSIDGNTFAPNGQQQAITVYSYNENIIKQKQLAEGKFYSISNTELVEYEGNGHTLSNFTLQENEHGNVGFFAQVGKENISQNFTVKNLVLENFTSESKKTEGNAGTLIGEVKENGIFRGENIFVINATVKAVNQGNAGGLIGKMSNGEIKQSGIYHSTAEKYKQGAYDADNNIKGSQFMVTSDGGAAGGLVGKIDNTAITDSFASIPVIASNNGVAGGLVGKNTGQETSITNSYTGGHTIEGQYIKYYGVSAFGDRGIAGGFIGQDTAQSTLIKDSYSTASVYGNIVGGFIGSVDNGRNIYKNFYSTGKVGGTKEDSKKDPFIGERKDAATLVVEQCYYLKQSNKDLESLVTGVKAQDYDELIEATNGNGAIGEYYAYDATLKDMEYPFGLATKTGAKKETSYKVHYGDWPVKEEKTAGADIGVVYYEIIDNQLYYHGYLADYSLDGSEPNYQEVMTDGEDLVNGLVTKPEKYVSEDGYIILVPEGTDINKVAVASNSSGERWKLSDCVEPLKNEHLFSMEGFDVYYFSKEINMYSMSYITLGENINPYYPEFGEYVSFFFNPYFADSVNITEISEEKFYIRSARQLLSITKLEWSHSDKTNVEYVQSLDISYENMNFTENGQPKEYTYETIGMISADYTAQSYRADNETKAYVIKGLNVPLFGTINPSSVVKGVTLINSQVYGIASFANWNNGVIEGCAVRAETPGVDSYNSVIVEGSNSAGFIGENYGKIRNSYFVGTVIGDSVSGFVGTNQGTIENSYANTILVGNTSASGFVQNNNGGVIKNSFVTGSIKSTGTQGVSYGFMQNSNNSIMENNYSALFQLTGNQIYRFGPGRGSDYSNCVWLDNTYIEGEVQLGNPYDLKEQGTAIAYEDMIKKGTQPKTYKYNSNYEYIDQVNLVYPFELISTSDAYLPMEFWGDWPKQDLSNDEELTDYENMETNTIEIEDVADEKK